MKGTCRITKGVYCNIQPPDKYAGRNLGGAELIRYNVAVIGRKRALRARTLTVPARVPTRE